MSAIYGVVSEFDNLHDDFHNHIASFSKYTFDRIELMKQKNAQFACFHQEFTNESKHEILPYFDLIKNKLISTWRKSKMNITSAAAATSSIGKLRDIIITKTATPKTAQ